MSLDTRGYDQARLLPRSLEDRLLAVVGRTAGALLLVVTAGYWAALVSWSIADPSLTYATATPPQNWLGGGGAIISDLALQTLGLAAVAALIPPIAWGVELLRDGRLHAARSRVGLYPIAALVVAGAVSALPLVASWPLHYGFGGALGDGLYTLVFHAFAVLNESRAGLAAGLVLIAGALVIAPKCVSLTASASLAALVADWRQRRSAGMAEAWHDGAVSDAPVMAYEDDHGADAYAPEIGYTDDPSLSFGDSAVAQQSDRRASRSPTSRSWWPWSGARRRPASLAEPDAGSDYDPGPLPGPLPRFSDDMRLSEGAPGPVAYPAGIAANPRDGFQPAASYQGAPHSPMAGYGPAHGPAQGPAYNRPQPPLDWPPVAHQDGADWQAVPPVVRGVGFDSRTETSSRAIAERFAPNIPPGGYAEEPARPRAPQKRPGFHFAGGKPGGWRRPSLNLLARADDSSKRGSEFTKAAMRGSARLLEDVLADFGVKGEVKDVRPGPVVTLFELEPQRGTKSSRVIGLADDIARSMSVTSVRAAVVPGRNVIGLELPNVRREPVALRSLLETPQYSQGKAALPLALGKGIGGDPVVVDLAQMPHLLVAGTTGSGKSVGINAMILSLLYKHSPDDCRFLMIDPKMLELSVYNGIPHLLTPVVTEPAQAVTALNWAVSEMEERYKRMAALNVRNIDLFNNRVRNALQRGERLGRTVQTGFNEAGQAIYEDQPIDMQTMPRIVIVVDEFADLMLTTGKEVEAAVQRLAQMARAAGIHLIMATQRPSVDIITGTIKANFPTRISFKVTTKVDSRTILNEQGAEQLLGQGDMLYSTGAGQVVRVHGPFVSDEEVEAIAEALRKQRPARYVAGILDGPPEVASNADEPGKSPEDLYDRAVAIVMRDRKVSTSYIQRRLSIGYNRAADLVERMERSGLISPADHAGRRTINASAADAAA